MLYIGSDHGGYELKVALLRHFDENGVAYVDCGCYGEVADYPDVAHKVCTDVLKDNSNKGILLCGTGIGISMAANKVKGIRAALCADCYSAEYARAHNDANVLCLGGRVLGTGLATKLADTFLKTEFEGGRHAKRIEKLEP